jgi:putative peptidoglycan lipid II flippase
MSARIEQSLRRPSDGIRTEVAQTIGVAGWTLVSRITGLIRVAVAGATLGPTFFANIFLATNTVPNLTYNLMAGSLLAALFVPTLVRALEHEGAERARGLAQCLLGVVLVGFSLAGVVVIGLGPLIVSMLTLGIGDGGAAAQARGQAWALLLLVVPQIVLYGVAAVGVAAQNARRRFALAAAAPAIENVGLVITLVLAAYWFGAGLDTDDITSGHIMFLGVGSTVSVAAHAGLQLVGAARVGMPLRPRWGWRDPAVRDVARRVVPTVGTAMIEAGRIFALVVAAGTVRGGVVALQIGLNFYKLPLALGSRAIGTVLMPRLSRAAVHRWFDEFARIYSRGLAQAWFVAVPASVALVLLGQPIAEALSFGQLDGGNATELVTASVAGLGIALAATATYDIAREASYARLDVRSPLVAGIVQMVVLLVAASLIVVTFEGPVTLLLLGLAVAVGDLVRAALVDRSVRHGIPISRHPPWLSLAWHFVVSVVVIVPASALAHLMLALVDGQVGAVAGLVLACAAGLAGYIALQTRLGAPELRGFRRIRPLATAVVPPAAAEPGARNRDEPIATIAAPRETVP